MPFIEFDVEGVCNYCNTYKKHSYLTLSDLNNWADGVRRSDSKIDSLVSFSGGRDSSYGLHYFVNELGLRPIAYTYDWGMITDLAHRNQKLMCERLNVEHVIITANLSQKRKNIQKNVLAWLKKPNLGMIPLFMAGDKQFFYYANKVKKKYKLNDILMASNPFEKTHFKSGFCGVKPAVLRKSENSSAVEKLPFLSIVKMISHYLQQYSTNPKYLNSSILDTFNATLCNFFISHKYMRLFDFIPWNEKEIDNVLINEYNWEKAPDTESTWRIGDGTVPFYNYIYYLIAGFTENDTLRSNQVREGMLSREKALELVYIENAPRFESMKWYFNTIDLDMSMVLNEVINVKKLY